MDWQPIKTFDYEAERARQGTMFVLAWVTDGTRVVMGSHWGSDNNLEEGWHNAEDESYDGPEKLDFEPTHWMTKPEPPK